MTRTEHLSNIKSLSRQFKSHPVPSIFQREFFLHKNGKLEEYENKTIFSELTLEEQQEAKDFHV